MRPFFYLAFFLVGCSILSCSKDNIQIPSNPEKLYLKSGSGDLIVYNETTNILTGNWVGNGPALTESNVGAYEGTHEYRYDYSVESWWDGFGLYLPNVDITSCDIMKFAYKGPETGITFKVKIKDGTGNVSNDYVLSPSSSYFLANIPISDLVNGTSVDITNIAEITFSMGGVSFGTGSINIDDIAFIQPPSIEIYNDNTNQITSSWVGNGPSITEVTGSTYEGTKHWAYYYSVESWWDGFGFYIPGIDITGIENLVFAYKGPEPGISFNVKIKDGSGNVSGTYSLSATSSYQVATVPISTIVTGTIDLTDVSEITFSLGGVSFGAGTVNIDDISFGGSSGTGSGGSGGTYEQPYLSTATINTPIPVGTPTHPNSTAWLNNVNGNADGGKFTTDLTQNSYTVYLVDNNTPTQDVTVDGYFSSYTDYNIDPDGIRVGYGFNPTISNVPIPSGISSGGGSDDQILFINTDTKEEWSFWQWDPDRNGIPDPTNGYLYNYGLGTGRTHNGGRGAGVAKYYGLVTAEEVEVYGEVNHAVAIGFDGSVLSDLEYVYPATKSDGEAANGNIPEGTRLQLDPTLTDNDFDNMGLTEQAKIIARAMQTYGCIVVDKSGRNKAFLESSVTGNWSLDDNTMEYILDPLVNNGSSVDWNRHFRIIDFNNWTGGTTGIINE